MTYFYVTFYLLWFQSIYLEYGNFSCISLYNLKCKINRTRKTNQKNSGEIRIFLKVMEKQCVRHYSKKILSKSLKTWIIRDPIQTCLIRKFFKFTNYSNFVLLLIRSVNCITYSRLLLHLAGNCTFFKSNDATKEITDNFESVWKYLKKFLKFNGLDKLGF